MADMYDPLRAASDRRPRAAAVSAPPKALAVAAIALCQLGAMALWFSASAVVPALVAEYQLSRLAQAALTGSVQVGFVVGCLVSASTGLADRVDPRRLFGASALAGAVANALLLAVEPTSPLVPVLRFVTGACMAGVYPVGMKLAATWARGDMGLMVGILVGALTLGSATPWLFSVRRSRLADHGGHGLGERGACRSADRRGDDRSQPGARAAIRAALRARRVARDPAAPRQHRLPRPHVGALRDVGVDRRVPARELRPHAARGRGARGRRAARLRDDQCRRARRSRGRSPTAGRTTITIGAMAASGSCAVLIGFCFGGSAALLVPLCLVWGVTIVADSAQFSASIAELAEPAWVGTMLSLQTAMGFTLTLATIYVMPFLVDALGWRYAFAPLALGPAFGIYAMARRAAPARCAGRRPP
jgi:MFS family permease